MKKASKKTMYAFALLAVVGAVVIAGCGGGGSSSSSSGSGSSGGGESNAVNASESGAGSTIGTGEVEGLGSVLVDSEGLTVYEFTVDKGTKSECYGGCESAWPPVTTTGKPTAGEGAVSSALGTSKRKDGTVQVTYEGHPLYTFAEDEAPGEANGNEDEGVWFALDESGTAVKGTATGGGGGGGY